MHGGAGEAAAVGTVLFTLAGLVDVGLLLWQAYRVMKRAGALPKWAGGRVMLAAWGFLRALPWQIYVAAAIAAAAWWGADHFYDRGVAETEAAARTAALKEGARQAAANELALKTGAEIVSDLADENERLNSLLEEIADEARTAPDRDACGFSADSLRLLDRIGGAPAPGGSSDGPHPGL